MTQQKRLEWSLLTLRIGVFIVMLMWTLDKFVNPDHAAAVFDKFYGLSGWGPEILYTLAGLELVLLAAFLAGWQKRITYGLVLAFHGVSTLSSFPQYLDAFNNLLFFAAWPMLAACIALYLLRDSDKLMIIGR
ncbi:MAG: hypothetical protein ACQES2_07405 [Pseudomonadota bacterium]